MTPKGRNISEAKSKSADYLNYYSGTINRNLFSKLSYLHLSTNVKKWFTQYDVTIIFETLLYYIVMLPDWPKHKLAIHYKAPAKYMIPCYPKGN